MAQEEKELLLKDLCARLPYGLKICYTEWEYGIKSTWDVDYIYPNGNIVCKNPYGVHGIERCQLYLRPMSSMTEEEYNEYKSFECDITYEDGKLISNGGGDDWLNSHHFDYRGLIEKGLAIEAPDNMYK